MKEKIKDGQKDAFLTLAGGPGFEPGLTGPEPAVLPLNYPPMKVISEAFFIY